MFDLYNKNTRRFSTLGALATIQLLFLGLMLTDTGSLAEPGYYPHLWLHAGYVGRFRRGERPHAPTETALRNLRVKYSHTQCMSILSGMNSWIVFMSNFLLVRMHLQISPSMVMTISVSMLMLMYFLRRCASHPMI